ncbi:MAG: RNA polymerase sigma factor region1.1 domain-containing protein [Planctomycetia bacterium]
MQISQEAISTLISQGKTRGFVTFVEIFKVIAYDKNDPTQLDMVLEQLEDQGIEIIDEDEQED